MVLKRGDMFPGDNVSADHYISLVKGRLPDSYGREKAGYTCGALMVDHASKKIFNYCQLSTQAADTLMSKHHLESLAKEDGFTFKKYHSDNGVFLSKAFKNDCDR